MNNFFKDFDDFGFEDFLCELGYTDHLLTNFDTKDMSNYKMAVYQFNDPTLYITDIAFDKNGNRLNDCAALRSTEYIDRSAFWRLFEKIRQ